MPLQAPNLDDRTFEDLLRELQLRIPRYLPEWTDFNDSDPGMTLVQLFTWLSDMLLYRLNQVPERNYIKFLQMLGMELAPPRPATAHLTFVAQPGAATGPVPPGTRVGAQAANGDLLIFETEAGIGLIRPQLNDVRVYDGAAFQTVTAANDASANPFRPFGWVPQVGSALYLGFGSPDDPVTSPAFPQQVQLRVFLTPSPQASPAQNARDMELPPPPPVELVWEYKPTPDALYWQRLNVFLDETAAFTRQGYIQLEGPPASMQPFALGSGDMPRYWLRCRLAGGTYATGHAPSIDMIRPNTVAAVNLTTVREEFVGFSTGQPNQVMTLRHHPVQPNTLVLSVALPDSAPEHWQAVSDFLASGPEDRHYTFNASAGTIHFGDGARGLVPPASAQVVADVYRYGGGAAGNVGAGQVSEPLTRLTGVESVSNVRRAEGGRDEQTVDDLRSRAPSLLRSRNRAVTVEDFATLALEAGGVTRARALPLTHPDFPGVQVPGAVTVVIVPEAEQTTPAPEAGPAGPPVPSAELIEHVSRYLNRHRLLTTELYVVGPQYVLVKVEGRVEAQPHTAFDAVARQVIAALNRHFSPQAVKGGQPGWDFGQDFYPSTLFSVMQVPDVVVVRSVELFIGGQPHPLHERYVMPKAGLFYTQDHDIKVTAYQDR